MAIQAGMYPENLGLIQNYSGGTAGAGGGVKGGSQDWMLQNGCSGVGGLNQVLSQKHQQQLYVQQQQYMIQLQQQQQQSLQQQQQNNHSGFVFSATSKNNTTNIDDYNIHHTNFVSSLDAQLRNQNQEIDTYLNLQNERLKMLFQQQRKQELSSLLRKLESRAKLVLTQKDEQLSKATKRVSELQQLVTKVEAENQVWRNLAFEKEATALSLHHELQKLKEEKNNHLLSYNNNNNNDHDVAEDAQSCCDDSSNSRRKREEEEEESEARKKMKMVCKGCNSGNLCVLFLPCRHLCSCKACEAFLDKCLVCGAVKKGSIEALLS